MQSRQIQTFGLIGTSVLILFIVIFLGKDFQKLYQYYISDISLSGLGDEQIVMESHAVENLKNILDEEGSKMLAGYAQKKTVSPALKEEKQTVQKNPPKTLSKVKVVEKTPVSTTKKIRDLLRSTPFFHSGLQLTDDNIAVLDKITAQLQHLPYAYKLEIEGHTEKGVGKYISQQMAQKIAAYLKKRLPEVKIESIGYANLYPISDDMKDLANRRIEIIVRRSDI